MEIPDSEWTSSVCPRGWEVAAEAYAGEKKRENKAWLRKLADADIRRSETKRSSKFNCLLQIFLSSPLISLRLENTEIAIWSSVGLTRIE